MPLRSLWYRRSRRSSWGPALTLSRPASVKRRPKVAHSADTSGFSTSRCRAASQDSEKRATTRSVKSSSLVGHRSSASRVFRTPVRT